MIEIDQEIASYDPIDRYRILFNALRREYTNRNMPLQGTFELTPHCTLDCKMCYVHTSKGEYPRRVLTGHEWLAIMDEAIDAGMLYATLTGGECMLHPDFRRIYAHLFSRGVFIQLLTNGTLIDEDMVAWLRSMPPISISITLYGSSPETYEEVTGSASAFYHVENALDLLHKAGIYTKISITVSRYSFHEFERTLCYAKQRPHASIGVNCDMQTPRSETGRKLEEFALSFDEQQFVWETYFRYEGKVFSPLCADDFDIHIPHSNTNTTMRTDEQIRLPCAAGFCTFFISYGGVMMPCILFELAKADVLEIGFRSAWAIMNKASNAFERSNECQQCHYFEKCLFCAAIYSQHSGGENGLSGKEPCDKKSRIIVHAILRKQ